MRTMYYAEVETVSGMIGRCLDSSKARIREAVRDTLRHGGRVRVWSMPKGLYDDGKRPYGWDAPTFKACGTEVSL